MGTKVLGVILNVTFMLIISTVEITYHSKSINFSYKECHYGSARSFRVVGDPTGNWVITKCGSEILYSWSHGNTSSGSEWSIVHHGSVYPSNNFRIREKGGSLGQLGQQCVGGGAQVLKEVLEALEMSDDLRRDTQRPPQSTQHVPVVSRVKKQGQVLDWVIVEHLHTVTWTEAEYEYNHQHEPKKWFLFLDFLLGASQAKFLHYKNK